MFKYVWFAVCILCFGPSANAATVNFAIHGRVANFQFETVPGTIAAISAVIPLGTRYTFTYSYDTATRPTFASMFEESYHNVLESPTFTLGGNSISADRVRDFNTVSVFRNGGQQFPRYGVSTNFPFGSILTSGFRGIDFFADLFDTRRLASPASGLPSIVNVADYDSQSARIRFINFDFGEVGVGLTIDRIETLGASVPEPASWAMMILGFGFVGASMRKRTRLNSPAI